MNQPPLFEARPLESITLDVACTLCYNIAIIFKEKGYPIL